VQYETQKDGHKNIRIGFNISPINPTIYEQTSLLQAQARMPLSSAFEMKGLLFSEKNNEEIEQTVVNFLKTSPVWCEKFSRVYVEKDCNKAITINHLTKALAEFESTLIFIDSPFRRYVNGNKDAISLQQKRGAILFYASNQEGGFNCASCHSGKILSDEKFYNLNIPSSGVGANESGYDFGRRNVDRKESKFRFRTPSLLNIETTQPYFHNGTALTLEDAVLFHIINKDLKKNIHRSALEGIDYANVDQTIEANFFGYDDTTKALLPTQMSDTQVQDIVEFLKSLTDNCLKNTECLKSYIHEVIKTPRPAKAVENLVSYTDEKRSLDVKSLIQPTLNCSSIVKKQIKPVKETFTFSIHDIDVGLNHKRSVGLVRKGWLLDVVNYGGVSVMDVDYDCLDDVVFDAGDNGFVFYKQARNGKFEQAAYTARKFVGEITPLIMDLDGDYKFDLFAGNDGRNKPYFAFDFINKNSLMILSSLSGPVINSSIADVDGDGDMDAVFAFWRTYNSPSQEHLWRGDGNGNLIPDSQGFVLRESDHDATKVYGKHIKRQSETPFGNGDVTFTPNFADIDNDGDEDLLLASDFVRSQVLINDNGVFVDKTQKDIIDDSNGMGAAIADFSNRGLLDWYVTSINNIDPKIGGNNLYKNLGNGQFEKMKSGIRVDESAWSWGACAQDFDNDGYVDIFYVSGYGEELTTAQYESDIQEKGNKEYLENHKGFKAARPRLLINNHNGTFENKSEALGLNDVFPARGVACFDYEQDGDIDILVNPVEGGPRLYKNELHSTNHWISLRLIGPPKNTEAFGAKVTLYAADGKQYREVRFENNYLSRSPAQIHFGLGKVEKIEKIIIQFKGVETIITSPQLDQLHIIKL
jgi:cytochrome c peroxidase